MTGYINVCYAIGALLNVGIVSAFDKRTDEWGYKIPFAIQWIWPVIIIPAVIVAPESMVTVRNGKLEEAEKALKKLSTPSANVDPSKTVAMMQKTDIYERKVETGSKIWDCLKGVALRRLEIAVMVFVVQDFAQSPVSPTYFFEQLGLSTEQAFYMSIGLDALGLVSTLLAAILVRYYGRRVILTTGIGICTVIQLLVGFLNLAPNYYSDRSFDP